MYEILTYAFLCRPYACRRVWVCAELQLRPKTPHLEGVLGHSCQAVVGHSRGNGADAEFADLVRLAELRDALGLHHAHQAWDGETRTHGG